MRNCRDDRIALVRTLWYLTLALLVPSIACAELTRYFIGNPADADPPLRGPAFDLAGGGGDVDDAFQRTVDLVRGCSECDTKLDLVVLRGSGADGYNEWFGTIDGLDSIETFVITDRDSAFRPDVVDAVRRAEIVFFAGGDQCRYVRYLQSTPVQGAVESVVARGGGVGGTSAGLAIMGDVVYDACPGGSTRSADALVDPHHWDIGLTTDFFRWQHLGGTITDTHFAQRDRLGRLLVFMARHLQTANAGESLLGIGVDERTSLVVDSRGFASVFGRGPVYFIRGRGPAEVFGRGAPLTWCGIEYSVVPSGASFDLRNRPARLDRVMDVVEGTIVGKPY